MLGTPDTHAGQLRIRFGPSRGALGGRLLLSMILPASLQFFGAGPGQCASSIFGFGPSQQRERALIDRNCRTAKDVAMDHLQTHAVQRTSALA
jgi:hypothetical protein